MRRCLIMVCLGAIWIAPALAEPVPEPRSVPLRRAASLTPAGHVPDPFEFLRAHARHAATAARGRASFCGAQLDALTDWVRWRGTQPPAAVQAGPNSTDAGEIAVLEDDGSFFIASPQGHPLIDLAPVGRAFYATHGDDYDMLAVYLSTGLDDWLGSSGALASAFVIRNSIQGIGLSDYDYASSFGAEPGLQVMLKMNGLHRYPADPFEPFPGDSFNALKVLSHEIAHRWLAYTWLDSAGSTVPALLGRAYQHWNFFFDVDASIMEGCDWAMAAPDSFSSVEVIERFSPVGQYLMGLRARADVDSFFVINAPSDFNPPGTYVPYSIPVEGIGLDGTATWWSLDDIETVNGVRAPAPTGAPDTLRIAFILITAEGQAATSGDLQKLEAIRSAIPAFWNGATDGRGFIDATLDSRAGQVVIDHLPLNDTVDSLSTRSTSAAVRIAQAGIPIALDPSSVRAFWRAGTTGAFASIPMTPASGDSFSASLPPLPAGGDAEYYLYASSDSAGIDAFDPPGGAAAPHRYRAGADHAPPLLVHVPVAEQGEGRLPQTLLVRVTDNVAVDSVWVSFGDAGGPLGSSATAVQTAPDTFEVAIGSGFADGETVAYRIEARDASGNTGVSGATPHEIDVGEDWFFEFENGTEGTSHLTFSSSYRDAWHLTHEDGSPTSPGTSWKSGGAPGDVYPAHLNGYMYLPWIPVVTGTLLRFDHRYAIEASSAPGFAWDGVWVEGWTSATGWQPIAPSGGYTHVFISDAGPFTAGAPCWSGNSGGWVSESLDLSAYDGGAVLIRFGMLADEFIGDDGWFVDHVRVDYPGPNVNVARSAPALAVGLPRPNPARADLRQSLTLPHASEVEWALYDVAGRRVARLWHGRAAEGAVELSARLPAGIANGLYFARVSVGGTMQASHRVVVLQ